jgi:hypothetical protein
MGISSKESPNGEIEFSHWGAGSLPLFFFAEVSPSFIWAIQA